MLQTAPVASLATPVRQAWVQLVPAVSAVPALVVPVVLAWLAAAAMADAPTAALKSAGSTVALSPLSWDPVPCH